jgi:antibiotic biosynthesis monooxygenase (ABM) superfamily enzyme
MSNENTLKDKQDLPTPARLTVTATVLYQTTIVVSLVFSFLAVVVYDHYFVQPRIQKMQSEVIQIAVFDFPGYLKQLGIDKTSGKITESQMLAKLAELTNRFDSQPPNVVTISGDCILGHPKQVRKIDAP